MISNQVDLVRNKVVSCSGVARENMSDGMGRKVVERFHMLIVRVRSVFLQQRLSSMWKVVSKDAGYAGKGLLESKR